MANSLRRPARTAIQGTAAYAVVDFIDAFLRDLNEHQFAAAVVLLTLVIGWAQVLVENGLGKGLFREPSGDVS